MASYSHVTNLTQGIEETAFTVHDWAFLKMDIISITENHSLILGGMSAPMIDCIRAGCGNGMQTQK